MATSCDTICGVCEVQHKTKEAEYWCPECEQGLCLKCLNYHNALKSSRNHEVIPVENYKQLPSSISSIQQHCSDHHRKFQIYCPQHESLCCPLCISSHHINCVGMLSMEEVIETSKTSSLLESMEQRLKDVMKNAKTIINDRKRNLSSIEDQYQKFQGKIKKMRDKISRLLDILVKQSLKDLQATEKKISKQIETVITNVALNYEHASQLKNEIDTIRKYASNLQAFLGAKTLEEDIQKKENFIQSLSDGSSLQQISISFEFDDEVSEVLSFQQLGSVSKETGSSLVVSKKTTDRQAQIVRMPVVASRSIQDIKLTRQKEMILPENITGCWINPSGKFIFAKSSELIIFREDGKSNTVIDTHPRCPVDVTCIDDKTVAVSFYVELVIQIINIMSKKVVKTINTLGSCSGIIHQDNKLLCCEFSKGIWMIDLSNTNNSLLIKDEALENINYITASVNRLYYTNRNKIYCYSLTGKKLWKFKDSTILMNISGLTIGKHHIIYVASRENNSIFVISPNGENVRRILGKGDAIADPRGIFINEENDTLLVTNYNGTAFLYKSTIRQRKLIQLFIKGIDSRTQTLRIDSNAMISELLKKIAELTGIDEDDFRLLHRQKKVCDKAMSIEDYNISDEETLSVILRIICGRMQKRRC